MRRRRRSRADFLITLIMEEEFWRSGEMKQTFGARSFDRLSRPRVTFPSPNCEGPEEEERRARRRERRAKQGRERRGEIEGGGEKTGKRA